MLNLHSHSRADLSRNHKVLDELSAMVEQISAAHGEQRDSATETFSSLETKPQKEFPLPCHGAAQAHDAGVESFQGQFEGEEL